MKTYCRIIFLVLIMTSCFGAFDLLSEVPPKPLWVQKGVKSLNEKRISKDYRFVSFHHELKDERIVDMGKMILMKENMSEEFGVDKSLITIDSIVSKEGGRTTYCVSFPSPDAREVTKVYVQQVDSYARYNDNIDATYDYDLDELYAVSEPDITPEFDNFTVTRKYGALPLAMSLVPGLGQIYKGQAAKGYTILGAEVAFCTAIAFGEIYRNYYMGQAHKNPGVYESWKSKANTFRTMRNIGIFFASATYLYNIFDAAFAKGAPHVIISRKNESPVDMVFSPQVSPLMLGAGLAITF